MHLFAAEPASRSNRAIPPNAAWRCRFIGDYLWRVTLWRRAKPATQLRAGISLAPYISFACASLLGEAAAVYGEIRAALETHGERVGGNDLWIAAHAKSTGLTVVTNNEREFKRVPGLKIQNWISRHS
jgi:hypothetical protein